jgi:SAM-dependent methyltransferase
MEKVKEEWKQSYEHETAIGFSFPNVGRDMQNFFERDSYVLEAGCGRGHICFGLERIKVNSLGIDIIPDVVKSAHLSAKTKNSNVQFIVGDVTHLPLKAASFDGLVSLGVIEHFRSTSEALQALKETHRILKNNGKAFFSVPNLFVPFRNSLLLFFSKGRWGMYHHVYTVNDLTRMVELSGFSSSHVDVVDLWLPIFFVIDGLLKIVRLSEETRHNIYTVFKKLPQFRVLKLFSGHIVLMLHKNGL